MVGSKSLGACGVIAFSCDFHMMDAEDVNSVHACCPLRWSHPLSCSLAGRVFCVQRHCGNLTWVTRAAFDCARTAKL